MFLKTTILTLALSLNCISNAAPVNASKPVSKLVPAADINWGYLNPLRGDKSPGAADLWGDRTKNVATGMLVKFNKGFSSPPHIHNISYRGVVIKGAMFNGDPNAKSIWMPTGSFWTQPAGENHITAANESENLIYLEIDSGPYLVKSPAEQFDNGERPINLHQSNMVWLDQTYMKPIVGQDIEITLLWGSPKSGSLAGTMLKIPAGFSGVITTPATEFKAIVIKGEIDYQSTETASTKSLTAGSYFSSTSQFKHVISNVKEPTLVYVRSNQMYQVSSN
ncbi:DUF4437 domain-containing protein [Paraglaciecola aquimarina]|uniref:DUF4437 domain-containing protein n=1 Tax=Paraglaciecola algarum TaxID=3050085 RepID=A0ABS9D5R4_9ALTE|nr:DUF4437 domain-containing protein [Paraglaciecola sp. G1-23]MCF2948019.1 DUF4437 domain-containing protein [Paraglaciecola sp. G1-23]